jgi:hypothetical protein
MGSCDWAISRTSVSMLHCVVSRQQYGWMYLTTDNAVAILTADLEQATRVSFTTRLTDTTSFHDTTVL